MKWESARVYVDAETTVWYKRTRGGNGAAQAPSGKSLMPNAKRTASAASLCIRMMVDSSDGRQVQPWSAVTRRHVCVLPTGMTPCTERPHERYKGMERETTHAEGSVAPTCVNAAK